MRLLLVTGRRAEEAVRRAATRLSELTGWRVDVYVAPVDVAALLPKEALKRIVETVGKGYDAVIVSGLVGYEVSDIAAETGVRVVKGPEDPYELVIAAEAGVEAFARSIEKGRFDVAAAVERWLELVREVHSRSAGVELCGVKVPLRPPPLVVVAEVYASGLEDTAARARELAGRGADIIVVGFGFEHGLDEARRIVRRVWDEIGPVAVDSPNPRLLEVLAREGYCCLAFSATYDNRLVERLPHGQAVAVTPVRGGGAPRDPWERAELTVKLAREASGRGLVPVADPILDPPLQGLASSLVAYYLVARELRDTVLLAGVANVYELLDADSHGVVAALVPMLAEAGVSMVLASEESRKTSMAVTETAVAATMTSIAMIRSTTPKNLGVDLLSLKEKRRIRTASEGLKAGLRVDADSLAWHTLRLEETQHIIYLADDSIRDAVLGGHGGPLELVGRSARSLYRAIAYLGLARMPDHLAYLGYELCKAELALKLGRSYVQDQELLVPPWRRRLVYSARRMSPVRV